MTTNDSTSEVPHKRCSKCKELKPTHRFYKRSAARDGLESSCKECASRSRGHVPLFVPPTGYRRCSDCHEVLLANHDNFHRNRTSKDGCNKLCKACARLRLQSDERKAYMYEYNRTPETLEKQRQRRQTPEYKAWQSEYGKRPENKERDRQRYQKPQRRARYQTAAYKEQRRRRMQSEAGKSVVNLNTQQRRARKRNRPDTLTAEQWQHAVDYFNGCCAICERPLKDLFSTHTVAVDHWIPLSNPDCPGTTALNCVPLCHGLNGCNNRKSNRDPVEFLETEFGKRRAKQILARIVGYFEWTVHQK